MNSGVLAGTRSTLHALWQVQLASMRNIARHDSRMRLAFIVVILFDIAIGSWSCTQLIADIRQWQAIGPAAVDTALWSICLLTWGGMVGVVILEALQQGLSDDISLLLFTLPIAPATRFRALYAMFFLRRLWNWLLLEIGITGVALVVTLGWQQALSWLLLQQLGIGCVVYGTLVTVMLIFRYILPRERIKTHIIAGIIITLMVALVLWLAWHPEVVSLLTWNPQGAAGEQGHDLWTRQPIVEIIFPIMVFALLLLMAHGPLANLSGKLYIAAFLSIQNWDWSRKTIGIPGIRVLSRYLERYRNLTGALFAKELLNQSRNVLFWGRIGVLVVVLIFFPLLHAAVASYKFSDTFFAVAFASGLALLTILEQAPNAISGEGNRLSLYLAAPFDLASILRAKLLVFVLPVLIEGLAIDLVVSWRLGLTTGAIAFSIVVVALVIIGCTALPVWGSVWDENLNLAVEGTIQMMMQEEAAITLRRLVLLNLSLLLFAASLLVWKLPPILAITALFLLNALVLPMMLQISRRYLRHLLSVA